MYHDIVKSPNLKMFKSQLGQEKYIITHQDDTQANYNILTKLKESDLQFTADASTTSSPNEEVKNQVVMPKIVQVYSARQMTASQENQFVVHKRLLTPPDTNIRKAPELDPLAIDEDFSTNTNVRNGRLQRKQSVIKAVIENEVIDLEREEFIQTLSRNGVTLTAQVVKNVPANNNQISDDNALDGKLLRVLYCLFIFCKSKFYKIYHLTCRKSQQQFLLLFTHFPYV